MARKAKSLAQKPEDLPEGYMARMRYTGVVPGSSDYPWLAQWEDRPQFEPRTGLEKILERINFKFFKPNGEIDVDRTNQERHDYAMRSYLPPIIIEGNSEKYSYRVISTGPDGVVEIKYTKKKPDVLVPLSDAELIPLNGASQYVGVDKEILKRMLKGGIFRGVTFSGKELYFNLNDLNRIFVMGSNV